MKKFILLFVLLVSCCFAKAETSWTVRVGLSQYNYYADFQMGVEASIQNDFSRWSLCPSINGNLGYFYGFDSQIMAGYDIPIGYKNLIKLKFGIIGGYFIGGESPDNEYYYDRIILGPSGGLDFNFGRHFVIGLNAWVSGIPIELKYDGYTECLWTYSLTFGYKF